MTDTNDEGIYRPLFVLVEAVEAEARRLLAPPAPKPALRLPVEPGRIDLLVRMCRQHRSGCGGLSFVHETDTQSIRLFLPCSLCRRNHHLRVSEEKLRALELRGREQWVTEMVDLIDELAAQLCPNGIELGAAGVAPAAQVVQEQHRSAGAAGGTTR